MIEEKVMETLHRLPAAQQREALNFMEYLAQKSGRAAALAAEESPEEAGYQDETLSAFTAVARFLTLDTTKFSVAQRRAYEEACAVLKQGREPDDPRILGLFAGLGHISDDFDAPLPEEALFWGEASDANRRR